MKKYRWRVLLNLACQKTSQNGMCRCFRAMTMSVLDDLLLLTTVRYEMISVIDTMSTHEHLNGGNARSSVSEKSHCSSSLLIASIFVFTVFKAVAYCSSDASQSADEL